MASQIRYSKKDQRFFNENVSKRIISIMSVVNNCCYNCSLSIDLHYPTPNLKTPITAAIDRGDLQILSFLLEKNSTDLDNTTTQPWARTALMYASYVSRNPEILQILLKKGADPGKVDM